MSADDAEGFAAVYAALCDKHGARGNPASMAMVRAAAKLLSKDDMTPADANAAASLLAQLPVEGDGLSLREENEHLAYELRIKSAECSSAWHNYELSQETVDGMRSRLAEQAAEIERLRAVIHGHHVEPSGLAPTSPSEPPAPPSNVVPMPLHSSPFPGLAEANREWANGGALPPGVRSGREYRS
jgi:hypothetical protein